MALSNAEKVRRYRERQKLKKQANMKEPTEQSDVFLTPFYEFFTVSEQAGSQYGQALELAGIEPPTFEDDSGPEASTFDDLRDDFEEHGMSNPFGSALGSSLGKAEVLVGCLLDAAADLAGWINDYKKAEIKARIAELENTDLADLEAKRAVFAKVADLGRMLEDLEKSVRWQLPQWKVEPRSQSS
jgi:hypothetical protein